MNGVESYVLGPAETQELYPLMNVKDIVGTLYCPGDGKHDTYSPQFRCLFYSFRCWFTGRKKIVMKEKKPSCLMTEYNTFFFCFHYSLYSSFLTHPNKFQAHFYFARILLLVIHVLTS